MGKFLELFGTTVHFDKDGRYSLNDIHKAAMHRGYASENHRPANFLRNANVIDFIRVVDLNAQICAIRITKGRYGKTYANELVALRYAGWISPEVEVEVYKTFQKVKNADEGLTSDLIERQTDPETSRRLAFRAQSKAMRLAFTDTLKNHGVTGAGYALCTDAVYKPLFGAGASTIKKHLEVNNKESLRDYMDNGYIGAVLLAEELGLKSIKESNAQGNDECQRQCAKAAAKVKSIL